MPECVTTQGPPNKCLYPMKNTIAARCPGPPAQALGLIFLWKSPVEIPEAGSCNAHHPWATAQGALSHPSSQSCKVSVFISPIGRWGS